MRFCVAIFLVLAVLVGCSLTDDSSDSTALSAPRLLLTNGQATGFLSHPTANDWAPQMVAISSNGGITTHRYLYFLSDRDLPYYSIYRAQHIGGSLFSNLEAVYSNTQMISSFVVSDSNSNYDPMKPDMYVSLSNAPTGKFILQRVYDFNYSWFSDPVTAVNTLFSNGVHAIGRGSMPWSGNVVFLFGEVNGYKVIRPYSVGNSGSLNALSTTAIYPIARSFVKSGFGVRTFRGACPLKIRLADGKSVFGFLVSYGGQFYLAYNRNATGLSDWVSKAPNVLTYLTDSFFTGEHVANLSTIVPPAGAIDRDPSYDPQTGLYFSSSRSGSFDLYFVPKSFFQFDETL